MRMKENEMVKRAKTKMTGTFDYTHNYMYLLHNQIYFAVNVKFK
jgi:hypothetical protein